MPSPEFAQSALASVKQKGAKYMAVSVVNVLLGQGLLILFHQGLGWTQTEANAAAVCISAFPAYYLSRLWVWGKSGKSHFRKEVLPFWIFVVIGLVFSTVMVKVSGQLAGIDGVPEAQLTLVQKLIPNAVNMASFGVLWVLRFFLMEHLFVSHPELTEELVGVDFVEAVEGVEAVAAAESAAADRATTHQVPGADR